MNDQYRLNPNLFPSLFKVSILTMETVLLFVLGLFMLIFGLLQFQILAGALPFNPGGTYGLLLVLISLLVITTGKTPFGTFRRTRLMIIIGICTAVLGTISCFIPGVMDEMIRVLAGLLLFSSGCIRLVQLVVHEKKGPLWIRFGGILRHLTLSCGLVYLTWSVSGIVLLFPGLIADPYPAYLAVFLGICFFYLSWCMQRVWLLYHSQKPGDETRVEHSSHSGFQEWYLLQESLIPPGIVFMLLLGVIFVLFAALLIPVYLGVFPFSRDSQFGLLMVLMAVQVLSLGKTPFGVYTRSWPLMILGVAVITLGMYACIIPGLITGWMLIPLGVYNLLTGSVGLGRLIYPLLREKRSSMGRSFPSRPMGRNLLVTIVLLYLSTLIFGLNVLLPGLIPGIVVLILLFVLGLLLLILAGMMNRHQERGKDSDQVHGSFINRE